jgi:hypothetical protein
MIFFYGIDVEEKARFLGLRIESVVSLCWRLIGYYLVVHFFAVTPGTEEVICVSCTVIA